MFNKERHLEYWKGWIFLCSLLIGYPTLHHVLGVHTARDFSRSQFRNSNILEIAYQVRSPKTGRVFIACESDSEVRVIFRAKFHPHLTGFSEKRIMKPIGAKIDFSDVFQGRINSLTGFTGKFNEFENEFVLHSRFRSFASEPLQVNEWRNLRTVLTAGRYKTIFFSSGETSAGFKLRRNHIRQNLGIFSEMCERQ